MITQLMQKGFLKNMSVYDKSLAETSDIVFI